MIEIISKAEEISSSSLPSLPLKQIAKATNLPYAIARSVMDFIESPWAPAAEDLPAKNLPEDFGNTSMPFRSLPLTKEELSTRASRMAIVREGSSRQSITSWSSIYSYHVPVKNLPACLENFTILHLSDIHFESHNPRPILELQNLTRWIKENSIEIDTILLSGDVITYHPRDLSEAAVQSLADLREVACSAYAVPGNHDYHGFKANQIMQSVSDAGFRNINNAAVKMIIDDSALNIHGVDDSIFGRPYCPRVTQENDINILLTHNLDAVRSNFPDKFDLILSGHTHWGEIKGIDGVKLMGLWGYVDSINTHTKGWDALTDRALSFVHPGLARHYIKTPGLWHPPGFVIHKLVSQ